MGKRNERHQYECGSRSWDSSGASCRTVGGPSGYYRPRGAKAFRVLEANQAEVYLAQEGLTVEAAMEAWKAGKMQRQLQADVEGHW